MDKKKNELKITIIGDLMSNYLQIPKLLEHGYEKVFEHVYGEFDDCDLLIGNLETPISKNKELYACQKYSFCAPVEFVTAIKKLSSNIVLLTANNHCLDRGLDGLKETIKILDEYKVLHTGTQLDDNSYLECDLHGHSIAILNYTYGTNAFSNHEYLKKKDLHHVNLLQPQEESDYFYRVIMKSDILPYRLIRKMVRKLGLFQINVMPYERVSNNKKLEKQYLSLINNAKKKSEMVISCVHIGGQYNALPNKYTRDVVNKSILSGVDIVSANHEHVIHSVGKNGGHFFNYSLGNFIGTNGSIEPPYDKDSDVSLGVNIYWNTKENTKRYSYSLFMSIADSNNIVQVYPMWKFAAQDEAVLARYQKYTDILSGKKLMPAKEHFI